MVKRAPTRRRPRKAKPGTQGGLVLLIRHCSALWVILVVIVGLTSLFMSGTAFSPQYMFTERGVTSALSTRGPLEEGYATISLVPAQGQERVKVT